MQYSAKSFLQSYMIQEAAAGRTDKMKDSETKTCGGNGKVKVAEKEGKGS